MKKKILNILFISATVLQWSGTIKAQNDKPNILWIVSEDNTTLINCYGDEYATTPNIDNFAKQGVLYQNAFSTAPVCAPSRNTLITGMLPTSLGTENMRSTNPVPSFVKFFPKYLRESGYYTTNNAKKDYNTVDQLDAWDESSNTATYNNRKPGQPFFAVFNIGTTHESSIFKKPTSLKHDPEKAPLPPYHPATEEFKYDWALYYDKIEQMDQEVGQYLKALEDAGLAENTIVFYYADNGGVLGRSKRFIFESGLHVPLIVRIPEKWKHLAPSLAGTKTDRLVSFVDFAPTVLNLAGIKIPENFQGKPFLGKNSTATHDYAFGFRGRMDESEDKVRTIRDKQYRYVRNYLPNKPYLQHINFLWNATSMRSWEREFKAGTLNELQSRYFKEKPAEELYDVVKDPHNVNNLVENKTYLPVLERMRDGLHNYILETKDAGFIPESQLEELVKTTTPHDYANSDKYDLKKILETAEFASSRESAKLPELIKRLDDKDPLVRFWAAKGIITLSPNATAAKPIVLRRLADENVAVAIVAAEAAYKLGEKKQALDALHTALKTENSMARVEALNVLRTIDKDDLVSFKDDFEKIKENKSEYDVRLAQYFLYGDDVPESQSGQRKRPAGF